MKVQILVVVLLGTGLSANIEISRIPKFKYQVFEPLGVPQNLKSNPELRIINGQEVEPHSIPFQVHISRFGMYGNSTCGGSFISPRTILTAAHCLYKAHTVRVILGGHDLRVANPGQISVNAASWKSHERFKYESKGYDIGVVILPNPVHASRTIDYVKLPSARDMRNSFVGCNARVSGWGFTSDGGSSSNVLLQVNNTIISNAECKSEFGLVTNKEICLSGAGGRSTCRGDSGGPLVVDNIQVGILSYGSFMCDFGSPSVFTRVTSFLDWIQANSDWRQS